MLIDCGGVYMKRGQKNYLSLNGIGLIWYLKKVLFFCYVWQGELIVLCFLEKSFCGIMGYSGWEKNFFQLDQKKELRLKVLLLL